MIIATPNIIFWNEEINELLFKSILNLEPFPMRLKLWVSIEPLEDDDEFSMALFFF